MFYLFFLAIFPKTVTKINHENVILDMNTVYTTINTILQNWYYKVFKNVCLKKSDMLAFFSVVGGGPKTSHHHCYITLQITLHYKASLSFLTFSFWARPQTFFRQDNFFLLNQGDVRSPALTYIKSIAECSCCLLFVRGHQNAAVALS